jgi:hypothetical protein
VEFSEDAEVGAAPEIMSVWISIIDVETAGIAVVVVGTDVVNSECVFICVVTCVSGMLVVVPSCLFDRASSLALTKEPSETRQKKSLV